MQKWTGSREERKRERGSWNQGEVLGLVERGIFGDRRTSFTHRDVMQMEQEDLGFSVEMDLLVRGRGPRF